MTSYEENGRQIYYLQDELGSPLRIADELGEIKESYGYGAFGEDLYGNQGEMQPFGYTGYQRDKVAGTYFAQDREFNEMQGEFVSSDKFKGCTSYPCTLHSYHYCFNSPLQYIDPSGLFTAKEGDEAHRLLQGVFLLTYAPNGIPEFQVTGYPYSVSGKGRADLVLFRQSFVIRAGNTVEVYEIKPITERDTGKGNIQREGYEYAMREMGYTVKAPTTFNPNYWVIPRTDVPNEYIVYYTFPDQTGMIYYGHMKNPDPKTYVYKENIELEMEDNREVKQNDSIGIGGVVVVGAFLLWLIEQAVWIYNTGSPSPSPCPI